MNHQTPAPSPCPICGAPGVITRHDRALRAYDLLAATCTRCGWHYTPKHHHKETPR